MKSIKVKAIIQGSLKIREKADLNSREIGSVFQNEVVDVLEAPVTSADQKTQFYKLVNDGYVLKSGVTTKLGDVELNSAIEKADNAAVAAADAVSRCKSLEDNQNVLTDEVTLKKGKLAMNSGDLIVREV